MVGMVGRLCQLARTEAEGGNNTYKKAPSSAKYVPLKKRGVHGVARANSRYNKKTRMKNKMHTSIRANTRG